MIHCVFKWLLPGDLLLLIWISKLGVAHLSSKWQDTPVLAFLPLALSLSLFFFFFLVLIDLSGLSLPERGHSAAEAVGPCVLYQGPSDSKSPILVD